MDQYLSKNKRLKFGDSNDTNSLPNVYQLQLTSLLISPFFISTDQCLHAIWLPCPTSCWCLVMQTPALQPLLCLEQGILIVWHVARHWRKACLQTLVHVNKLVANVGWKCLSLPFGKIPKRPCSNLSPYWMKRKGEENKNRKQNKKRKLFHWGVVQNALFWEVASLEKK